MSDIPGAGTDGTVDRLLRDAGLDDDAVLRSALQDLRGLAGAPPPASAAVAALMVPAATRHLAAVPAPGFAAPVTRQQTQPTAGPGAATPTATDELAARRRAKRRITLTTMSVAVSLAAGGAVAVASDRGLRDSIGHVNQAVSSIVATMGGGSTPAPPEKPALPPARPVSPATVPAVPAAPAATQPGPATPGSNSGPGRTDSHGQPSPAPAATLPDLPVPGLPGPENLTPGLPPVPDRLPNGEGQPPALPLPSTPPVHLPGGKP
jgi:hypothetical protein